jgi:hypothetical protein
VYCVADRLPMAELVVAASRIDEGLDASVLADMADSLDRFTDDEIAGFGQEAQDIRGSSTGGAPISVRADWSPRRHNTDVASVRSGHGFGHEIGGTGRI